MKYPFDSHQQLESLRRDPQFKKQILEQIEALPPEQLSEITKTIPGDLPDKAQLLDRARDVLRPDGPPLGADRITEAIILVSGRPVFFVKNGSPELTGAEVAEWRTALDRMRSQLQEAAFVVGRVEGRNHPQYTWFGTGWLVADDLIVTNRHVAELFTASRAGSLVFRAFQLGQVVPRIDFLAEVGSDERGESAEYEIVRPVFLAQPDDPDIAIMQVRWSAEGPTRRPLTLSKRAARQGEKVAVMGYPARDSRARLIADMERIYGGVYDVKRLAPGEISAVWPESHLLAHDATTLGGNSGSVVISLESGEAVGLHFAGAEQQANYCVAAATLGKLLERLPRTTFNGHAAPAPAAPGAAPPDDGHFLTLANEMVNRRCQLAGYQKINVSSFRISGRMIAYASPDSTYAVTRRLFDQARESILIGIYDFSARHMVEAIFGALERGVAVSLMLDIDSAREREVFDELQSFGVECVPAPSCASDRANYFASSHEKVIVIDNRWTLIQSGNYSNNSVPLNEDDGVAGQGFRFGNRDMGIAIESGRLARFFTRLLRADMQLELGSPAPEFAPPRLPAFDLLIEAPRLVPDPLFPSQTFDPSGSITVQPVLTPDNYMREVAALLAGATRSVRIEQQYIKLDQPNIKQLLAAIPANLEVQIILARPMSRGAAFERDLENIRRLEREYGFEVRILSPRHFVHCHNKLIIVDDDKVLISSQNWSDAAVVRNREAGVIVYDRAVTRYYARIFAADWTMSDDGIEEMVAPPVLSTRLESFAAPSRRLLRLDASDIQEV